jgi:KDO2-lipid IV(A) lauroyltransferase
MGAMARLILASRLDGAAKRFRWLRELLFGFEALFVYACWYGFKALSPERASALGRRIVGALGPRSGKAEALAANLRVAFPELDDAAIDATARRFWGNLGAVFGEYPHLERIALEDGGARLELVDNCGLERYRTGGQRAVFFGAHVANWELLALALARAGVRLLALYAPLQNVRLGRLMDRARRQLGCELLARDASPRPILKHLADGGSLGLLVDLKVDDGIEVPFFGEPMRTSATPARMAARFGCDVVPIRTERLGPARYRVTVLPPLPEPPPGDEEARLRAHMRAMNEALEAMIRAHPDEWLATNRRWGKTTYARHPRRSGGDSAGRQ